MREIGTNERTRYELVAEKDGRRILIGYTARKSRDGAIGMLMGTVQLSRTAPDGRSGRVAVEMRLRRLARATGTDPEAWRTERGVIATCDGWTVRFSGRTQRDARSAGELADTIYDERYDA